MFSGGIERDQGYINFEVSLGIASTFASNIKRI